MPFLGQVYFFGPLFEEGGASGGSSVMERVVSELNPDLSSPCLLNGLVFSIIFKRQVHVMTTSSRVFRAPLYGLERIPNTDLSLPK